MPLCIFKDVVAGTRTPQYITKKAKNEANVKELSMEESMPKVYSELYKIFFDNKKSVLFEESIATDNTFGNFWKFFVPAPNPNFSGIKEVFSSKFAILPKIDIPVGVTVSIFDELFI